MADMMSHENVLYHLKTTDQLISKVTSAAVKSVVILREISLKYKVKTFKHLPTT